jgi:hypothetical protein
VGLGAAVGAVVGVAVGAMVWAVVDVPVPLHLCLATASNSEDVRLMGAIICGHSQVYSKPKVAVYFASAPPSLGLSQHQRVPVSQ